MTRKKGARTNCNDMMMMATVTSSLYALYNKLAFHSFILLQLAAGWLAGCDWEHAIASSTIFVCDL